MAWPINPQAHTSRLAKFIQVREAPVNPMFETNAIASFMKTSIATSIVCVLFLYVRLLFSSSNIAVTVNQS